MREEAPARLCVRARTRVVALTFPRERERDGQIITAEAGEAGGGLAEGRELS